MKTWINKIFLLCLLPLALSSCEKDEDRLILRDGTAPVLTASATSLELLEEEGDKNAVTMTWTASDYGYPAAVNYTLQLDMKGNNFAAPVETDLGSALTKTFTVREFNNLLNRLPVKAFDANEIDARIVSSISENITAVNSNIITFNAIPYLTEPPYATIFMVGDATEFGWDNTKATPMYRSEEDIFVYTYTGPLKGGALKFLGERGKWAPQWGNDGSNGVAFRETESDPDPGTFSIPSDGYYTVKLDLRNMSFTPPTAYNAAGARTYASVGIIGGFNNWGGIVAMTKTAFNPHAWSLEHIFAADTELKFRHAPDWDVNWGTEQGKETDPFGKGKQGGENIKVSAGTYTILFNDLTGHYVFIKK